MLHVKQKESIFTLRRIHSICFLIQIILSYSNMHLYGYWIGIFFGEIQIDFILYSGNTESLFLYPNAKT